MTRWTYRTASPNAEQSLVAQRCRFSAGPGFGAWLGMEGRSPVPRAGITPFGSCRASQGGSSYRESYTRAVPRLVGRRRSDIAYFDLEQSLAAPGARASRHFEATIGEPCTNAPPRHRQPPDRGGSRTRVRAGRPTGATGRNPQPLLPRSRLIGRSNIGTGRDVLAACGAYVTLRIGW